MDKLILYKCDLCGEIFSGGGPVPQAMVCPKCEWPVCFVVSEWFVDDGEEVEDERY